MGKMAVIFDLDGTLTRPYLDFDAIRAEIGLPPGPILESIATLSNAAAQRARRILERHEWEAAENAELQPGALEITGQFRASGFPIAVLTRNSRAVVNHFIEVHGFVFDAIRTRDDGAIKPSPEPVLSICRELCADPRATWVVGDFLFDILSGRSAGARTVLFVGDGSLPEFAAQADHLVRSLYDLPRLIAPYGPAA